MQDISLLYVWPPCLSGNLLPVLSLGRGIQNVPPGEVRRLLPLSRPLGWGLLGIPPLGKGHFNIPSPCQTHTMGSLASPFWGGRTLIPLPRYVGRGLLPSHPGVPPSIHLSFPHPLFLTLPSHRKELAHS